MKVIGVEIDGGRVNFIGLENSSGDIVEISSVSRHVDLGDDKDFEEVRRFRDVLYTVFSSVSPDIIGIYFKQASGKHSAGPITYKVEGLIQLYEGKEMRFVHHKSIAALKNRKGYEAKCQFAYQQKAADVAYYLIHYDH